MRLSAEAVEGAALALERVDDIHGGDGLPASVLGVGDGIADDGLKEDLENTTGLLVDEAGDALDTTTAESDGGSRACWIPLQTLSLNTERWRLAPPGTSPFFPKREHGRALEAEVRLEVLRDLVARGAGTGARIYRLLVWGSRGARPCSGAVAVRLLHAARRRGRLARGLGRELLRGVCQVDLRAV